MRVWTAAPDKIIEELESQSRDWLFYSLLYSYKAYSTCLILTNIYGPG